MPHWPDIPYPRFAETGKALHMWSQIVGKLRIRLTPWLNHSWHATFYVNGRGLTSSLMHGETKSFETQFDFRDHALHIDCTDGSRRTIALKTMSVADFHAQFLAALGSLGAPTNLHHAPNEIPDPVPFKDQTDTLTYDPDAAHDFWQALVAIDAVFGEFRTGFLGKSTLPHLFWGSFDFAVTRFSGRPAPTHPGGFPALPDEITREAYSHEVHSAGFWPGGNGADEAMFYAYAYPTPDGFADATVAPDAAFFDQNLGEFLLPYDAVRTASSPRETLLAFLQSTYDAAADLGKWDRAALDCSLGSPGAPRPVTN
ncbi:DUF5996 family protein [Aestuariibius sp. 2305UL40-4]|uniref:DUF5996 family protein n=1 Tax=Aestuariibius violaceus TaxID=3234132 RepID=UPI00345E9657